MVMRYAKIVKRRASRTSVGALRLGRNGLTIAAAAGLPIGTGAAACAQSPVELSVLTYNVEGLSWPIRTGRPAALAQIGERLGAMRAARRQPHVIVLEEAFSPEAKAVATRAGYRYIADGPTAAAPGPSPMSYADKAFAAAASFLSGETWGKWSDSGIRVASDYPILAVRRLAYPTYACAGWDCLANKGAMLVTVKVPGVNQPVAIVATHLNSRRAAGVDYDRSFYAFQRQVDLLGQMVRTNIARTMPLIVAGDFNAGQEERRRAYLLQRIATWRTGAPVHVAVDKCLREGGQCSTNNRGELRMTQEHGRDWQMFAPPYSGSMILKSVRTLFGPSTGTMLSDHMGFAATYSIAS